MADTAICTLSGTTTEGNLADRMGDIPYEPITFEENEQIQAAFIAGQCDGWTSDRSQLAGVRSTFPDEEGGPESLVIFDEIFSKEPLGPVVRDGDSQWAQVVDWVVLATIQAEEFGIDSTNVASFDDSDDPDIRRFLGLEIEDPETGELAVFDPGLGIEPGWQADDDRGSGQLRRDLRAQRGAGEPARTGARVQRPLDRWRAALRPALPVIIAEGGGPGAAPQAR